jgi:hypothetical protein
MAKLAEVFGASANPIRVYAAAALIFFIGWGGNAPASNVNAADSPKLTALAGPAKAELITLEKNAYEAWKSRDAEFWAKFLSNEFVGWGSLGRLDKTSAAKEYTGTACEINSYALSDEHVSTLDKDVELITYKATVDGACGVHKLLTSSRAATVYVRDGAKWKIAFHAQAPIVDPKESLAKPVELRQALDEDNSQPANHDPRTGAMLAIEKVVWEAWRTQNVKKIADLTAGDISFINIFGSYFATKADALHDWSQPYCEVKNISITNAMGARLSPAIGILTFKAAAEGTCSGQKIGPIWGSSIYVKDAEGWKWTFGINVPARR